ncbi:MAG: CRISPR-associated endonuclease Cas2 [Desulfobulbus sp.]|nr:CRISPR-associated endonuclease Cas2 [Desulfobulbus sp.]
MIAYDIEDDAVRRKVADLLENHGERVQYSVFECRLPRKRFTVLRQQVLRLLHADDSLRCYPLCRWCRQAIAWQGEGAAPEDEGFIIA